MKVGFLLQLEAKGTAEEERKIVVMELNFVEVAMMVTVVKVAAVTEVVDVNLLMAGELMEEAENVLAGEKIELVVVGTVKGKVVATVKGKVVEK